MSDAVLLAGFCAAAAVSLTASWQLVSRLERIGARLGLAEGLLGLLAALAADAPEITAAVTALAGHHSRIGAGVVIGSNVFNLAALLGFAPIVAGGVMLHRRVILFEGIVAVWVAGACLAAVVGVVPAYVALAAALVVLLVYVALLGLRRERLGHLGLPRSWTVWLSTAIVEEELELGPREQARAAGARTVAAALLATLIVVGASVAMEQSAVSLGSRHAIPAIVIGALILAAVTSLPNAVAAIYLARRGRGAATLSTALNSNAINVTAGLLLPAALVGGLSAPSSSSTLVAAWYLGLTLSVLLLAHLASGLRRGHGVAIVCAYAAFTVVLLLSS